MIDWVKRRFIRGMEITDGGIVPPPTGHTLFSTLAETEQRADMLAAEVERLREIAQKRLEYWNEDMKKLVAAETEANELRARLAKYL